MPILFKIIIIFALWFFLGIFILVAVDDNEQRLFKWVINAPLPGLFELTIILWPVVVGAWLINKKKGK